MFLSIATSPDAASLWRDVAEEIENRQVRGRAALLGYRDESA